MNYRRIARQSFGEIDIMPAPVAGLVCISPGPSRALPPIQAGLRAESGITTLPISNDSAVLDPQSSPSVPSGRRLDRLAVAVKTGITLCIGTNFAKLLQELIRFELEVGPIASRVASRALRIQERLSDSGIPQTDQYGNYNVFEIADFLRGIGRDNVWYKDDVLAILGDLKELDNVGIGMDSFSRSAQIIGTILGNGLFPMLLHLDTLRHQKHADRFAEALSRLAKGNTTPLEDKLKGHGRHDTATKFMLYFGVKTALDLVLSNYASHSDSHPLAQFAGSLLQRVFSPQLALVAFAMTKLFTGWMSDDTQNMQDAKRELLDAYSTLSNEEQAEIAPLILGDAPRPPYGFGWVGALDPFYEQNSAELPVHRSPAVDDGAIRHVARWNVAQRVTEGAGFVANVAKFGVALAGSALWAKELLPVKWVIAQIAMSAGTISDSNRHTILDEVDPGVFVGSPGQPGWRRARGLQPTHLDMLARMYGKLDMAAEPLNDLNREIVGMPDFADLLEKVGYAVVGLVASTMILDALKGAMKEKQMAIMAAELGVKTEFSKLHMAYKLILPLLYICGVKVAYEIAANLLTLSSEQEDDALKIMLSELALMVGAAVPVVVCRWNPLHPEYGQYDLRGVLLRNRRNAETDAQSEVVATLILDEKTGIRDVLATTATGIRGALKWMYKMLPDMPHSHRFGSLGNRGNNTRENRCFSSSTFGNTLTLETNL